MEKIGFSDFMGFREGKKGELKIGMRGGIFYPFGMGKSEKMRKNEILKMG